MTNFDSKRKPFNTCLCLLLSESVLGKMTNYRALGVSKHQVNMRTLQTGWELYLNATVNTGDDTQDSITFATELTNAEFKEDYRQDVQPGEVFQTYLQLKDPEKTEQTVKNLPARTQNPTEVWEEKTIDIPYYENVVCTMTVPKSLNEIDPSEPFPDQYVSLT